MATFWVPILVMVAFGRMAHAFLLGDLNDDGMVTIGEVQKVVNNLLGARYEGPACPSPSSRYVDNRNGTISDNETGLTWEKKIKLDDVEDYLNPHDVDNSYRWAGYCSGDPAKICQPNAAASATCLAGVRGDPLGCFQCVEEEGGCTVDVATIWEWVAQLNAANFGGYNDWRVPTKQELLGMVDDNDATEPSIDVAFDGASCGSMCSDLASAGCSCTTSANYYWSATTVATAIQFAFNVFISEANLDVFEKRNGHGFARAVRGGTSLAIPHFTDSGDGTIRNDQDGRQWEKKVKRDNSVDLSNLHDADNRYPWANRCSIMIGRLCQPSAAASAACLAGVRGNPLGCAECTVEEGACSPTTTVWEWLVALNGTSLAGHSDWRLPSKEELMGIVDDLDTTSPIVNVAFDGPMCGSACADNADAACSCTALGYWSGSTSAIWGAVWYVDFLEGYLRGVSPGSELAVRAVRGGS